MRLRTKDQIRKCIRQAKSLMSEEEVKAESQKIQQQLFDLKEYEQAGNIYTYVSYNQEVLTKEIISRSLEDGKKVFVPKIYDDIIKFHRINSFDELKIGRYNILEPENMLIDEERKGLLIMPGLAFDKFFHRIGYGGGYYDRYLSMPNEHIKLALAYDFQILDCIETDENDKNVEIIVTQNYVMRAL